MTEHSDHIGHSTLVEPGTQDSNSIASFGPDPQVGTSLKAPNGGIGDANWPNHVNDGSPVWRSTIGGINKTKVLNYGTNLATSGKVYNLYTSSCVTHTSIALIKAGFFNIGIHPYLLHAQVALRNLGVRSHLFTTHLQNP